jgi:hypothetical protein
MRGMMSEETCNFPSLDKLEDIRVTQRRTAQLMNIHSFSSSVPEQGSNLQERLFGFRGD